MYKLFLISILTTFLAAANPKPYAALGDTIYNSVKVIEGLKELDAYTVYMDDINTYLASVADAKKLGYLIEQGKAPNEKKNYLNKLRKLSQTNDYYLRSIETVYKTALKEKEFDLFSAIINGHYIDTNEHKKEIIDYYFAHQEDINSSGIIDTFLEEDAALKARKEAQKKRSKTKKQLEEEKIKRIRANDKSNQERVEKELEKDLETKQLQIREDQKKELAQ